MIAEKDNKVYIAVHEDVPDHMVPVLVAHSMLGAHLAMNGIAQTYDEWLKNSFRKCVLSVNQKEFDKIMELDGVYAGHENKTLDGRKSCIVVSPRQVVPNVLKFAKMWKPKKEQ